MAFLCCAVAKCCSAELLLCFTLLFPCRTPLRFTLLYFAVALPLCTLLCRRYTFVALAKHCNTVAILCNSVALRRPELLAVAICAMPSQYFAALCRGSSQRIYALAMRRHASPLPIIAVPSASGPCLAYALHITASLFPRLNKHYLSVAIPCSTWPLPISSWHCIATAII